MIEDETVWLDFVHEASGFFFQPSVGLYSSSSNQHQPSVEKKKNKEKEKPAVRIESNVRIVEDSHGHLLFFLFFILWSVTNFLPPPDTFNQLLQPKVESTS